VLVERAQHESAFLKQIAKRNEVQECHLTSGEYPILLKIRLTDAAELERFVNDRIKTVKGVLRVRVDVVLSTHKETPAVPVNASPVRDA
jgi:Lrp/AsnC family leucine-responsive transcriptional regulator